METNDVLVFAGLGVFSLVAGIFTAQISNEREAVAGDAAARLFHYLAASLWSGATPAVLVLAILVRPEWVDVSILGWQTSLAPLVQLLAIAFGMVLLAYVCLLIYAVLAKDAIAARTAHADQGWTEADARSSGL
jgi:hypothetical protein